MKKWKPHERPTLLFNTGHRGDVGGGEIWAHQIAMCLDGMTDLRYFGQPPGKKFRENHRFDKRFSITAFELESDIYLYHNYFHVEEPKGKERNILLVMFPKEEHKEASKKYDTIITCSQYGADYVKKYWGKQARVVYPFIDTAFFERFCSDKGPIRIVNVARFFREQNGQSKNQHVLIESLVPILDYFKCELHLAGSCLNENDKKYLEECKEMAEGLPVVFHENVSPLQLKKLYRDSHIYWHANGFGRKSPSETEHFGISIAEAMSSGCVPIVYNGGAASLGEFGDMCRVWKTKKQLVDLTCKAIETGIANGSSMKCRRFVQENFSREAMYSALKKEIFK